MYILLHNNSQALSGLARENFNSIIGSYGSIHFALQNTHHERESHTDFPIFNTLIRIFNRLLIHGLCSPIILSVFFLCSVTIYADQSASTNLDGFVADDNVLYAVSLERISEKQALYRAELKNNARMRTSVLVGGSIVTAAVGSYVVGSYLYPSTKKNDTTINELPDLLSLDDVYKQIRVREFLQREEDLKLSNIISNHVKQGVGYAFSAVTAAYLVWLFTDIKDRCTHAGWLSSIYTTDDIGFRVHAKMVYVQLSHLEDSLQELAAEFSAIEDSSTINDFKEFKEFFVAGVVDAHNGLIIALENVMAYLLESIALQRDTKKQGLSQYFEAKIQPVLVDLQANHKTIAALMASESEESLLSSSHIVLGRNKKMMRRLGKILQFFGEHIYGLIKPSSDTYE